MWRVALIAGLVAATARPVRADGDGAAGGGGGGDGGPGGGELTWNPRLDAGIVIGGAAAWIASETVFKSALAPDRCRWCGVNELDRGWRDAMRWDDTHLANQVSNLTGFAIAPLGALGLELVAAGYDHHLGNWTPDAVIILEATVLAIDLDQAVKFTAGRERPFVHALPDSEKPLTDKPQDNNLSFYSGHTTFATALAVSAGTVATLRRYRLAPVIWAVGLTAAAATGWLRMAADKHYFTDVLTGAATGAAFGFAVPWYLHRGHGDRRIAPVPVSGGMALAWTGTW